jgi:toxin ParE1/3/4
MARVRYAPAARDDLEAIDTYLSEFNPVAAWKVIERIRVKTRKLLDMPERGRARPELGEGMRQLTVGNYLVFYRPNGPDIDVVRVLHGARNVPREFEKQ